MAKTSKAQYELLTEAFGDALAEVQERDSPLFNSIALGVIHKVANSLKYDNPNFDIKRFMDGVKATAELVQLTKKGIH